MTNYDNTENKQYYINVYYKVGGTTINERVPVTEEVYRAYKRPLWAEDKRQERASRCQISKENGKTKRCDGDCSQCEYFRSGADLSLEKLEEDSGHSLEAPSEDLADIAIYNELLQELFHVLEELDPTNRRICEAIMEGKYDREIAAELGYAARTTFSFRKYKLFKELRERLKDYR